MVDFKYNCFPPKNDIVKCIKLMSKRIQNYSWTNYQKFHRGTIHDIVIEIVKFLLGNIYNIQKVVVFIENIFMCASNNETTIKNLMPV